MEQQEMLSRLREAQALICDVLHEDIEEELIEEIGEAELLKWILRGLDIIQETLDYILANQKELDEKLEAVKTQQVVYHYYYQEPPTRVFPATPLQPYNPIYTCQSSNDPPPHRQTSFRSVSCQMEI